MDENDDSKAMQPTRERTQTQSLNTSSFRVNTGVSDNINCGRVLFSVAPLTAIPVSQHAQLKGPANLIGTGL